MNATTCIQHMGKVRERRESPHGEAIRSPSLLVQRKTLVMIAVQAVIWSWLPISLAAVAAQSTGHDTGVLGSFLVPGSAAASVIACVWLFIARMKVAGEETAANIKAIMDSHTQSTQLLASRLEENTESVREMNRWIRECVQHKQPKDKP